MIIVLQCLSVSQKPASQPASQSVSQSVTDIRQAAHGRTAATVAWGVYTSLLPYRFAANWLKGYIPNSGYEGRLDTQPSGYYLFGCPEKQTETDSGIPRFGIPGLPFKQVTTVIHHICVFLVVRRLLARYAKFQFSAFQAFPQKESPSVKCQPQPAASCGGALRPSQCPLASTTHHLRPAALTLSPDTNALQDMFECCAESGDKTHLAFATSRHVFLGSFECGWKYRLEIMLSEPVGCFVLLLGRGTHALCVLCAVGLFVA